MVCLTWMHYLWEKRRIIESDLKTNLLQWVKCWLDLLQIAQLFLLVIYSENQDSSNTWIMNEYLLGFKWISSLKQLVNLLVASDQALAVNSNRRPCFPQPCCYQSPCWSNNKNIGFGPCGTENLIVWTGAKSIQNLCFLSDRMVITLGCEDSIEVGNSFNLARDHPFLGREIDSIGKNLKSESSFLISSWLLGNVMAFWRE